MNPGILAFVLETWSGCIQAGWGSDLWPSAVVLWNSASHVSTMLRSNLDLPIIRSLIFYILLLRKSVIYCSFPYNGVPHSCVKLVILCCNWCIITSVILPFPAHHRLSARVRCIERTPLKATFVFHLRAGRAYWPPGAPGHSRWIGHRSEEELPRIRHCF